MKMNYDEKFDVLYVKFSDNSNSVGDEDDNGVIVHKDCETGEVTSITVFDFKRRMEKGT